MLTDLCEVLRSVWHEGFAKEVVARVRKTLETGESHVAQRVAEWRNDAPEIKGSADYDEFCRTGIRAVQSTPLFARTGVLVGMLSTHWNHPYRSTDGELRAFDILARQVADFLQARRTG